MSPEENEYKRLLDKRRRIHKASPDYNSIVYLNQNTSKKRFEFFGLFGQHEDKYFNSSRNELSQDMFPRLYNK